MNKPTFSEWLADRDETRLAKTIDECQNFYRQMWEQRNDPDLLGSSPAWELCLGQRWQESLEEWQTRWVKAGGRLSEGRMIAAKWDSIWERLSSTCYDGLGFPFPPYARSSCAYWTDIDDDEAIVVGAISESEFENYMAQFPYEPLKDREGNIIPIELLQAAVAGADEVIYRLGGPRPGASRAERVDHMRKQREESNTRIREEYEQRNAERDSQNAVFRLLEEVETLLRDAPCIVNSERWEWLCKSLSTLTATEHFERYPNWRARAWVASATMYRHLSDSNNELACLECALKLNAKLPIKRRIKALETQK